MCEAYIPPTPFPQSSFTKGDESMDFSDSGETLMPWKAQFQTMVRVHVYYMYVECERTGINACRHGVWVLVYYAGG